ncbi:hypothetical protein BH11VER1_BH11VER1_16010 [soil metagenome]
MSLRDTEIVRLNEWLHAMEEGKISESEHQQLEEMLLKSEGARRFTVQRLSLGAAMCGYAGEAQSTAQESDNVLTFPTQHTRKRNWLLSSSLTLAAALAICAISLGLLWQKSQKALLAGPMETKDGGCAVLVDAVGVQWAEGSPHWQAGMAVPAGAFKLDQGLVRLEFYSGASVTLEGKSELEIISVNEARCRSGQMRVHVPTHARGFKMLTPDADVIDLGTEFGLKVSDSGKSEVHVFDGEVEVYPNSGSDKLSLKQGAVWDAAKGADGRVADDGAFPNLASLRSQSLSADEQRLLSWRQGLQKFLDDPRLLVGYTFEPINEWDRTVRNQARQAEDATHGSIVGAQWSPGRWKGKHALEFKSPGDRVRLAVDGEYQAITLAAWVQVGGIDRKYSSLFLTDTWEPGNPHWQFVQDGSYDLGIHANRPKIDQYVFYSPKVIGPENLGIWFHLATTFDMRTGVGRHYVNGKVVSDVLLPKDPTDTRIRIGSGELGNWGLPEGRSPRTEVRSFNGRMDEFLLFKEALSPTEIGRIYDLGKPN